MVTSSRRGRVGSRAAGPAEPGGHARSAPPAGSVILVAEDSPTQAEWIRLVLEERGHTVAVVPDGLGALERSRVGDVELILADVEMPGIDGFELCRRLKDDPLLRRIPVVILTQRDRVTDVIRALEVGADNYLTKPLPVDELTTRVDRLLAEVRAWERRGRQRHRLASNAEELVLTFERSQVVEMLMGAAEKLESELSTVGDIGLGLTMDHPLDELLGMVASRTRELAEAAAVGIALPDDDGNWVFRAVSAGHGPIADTLVEPITSGSIGLQSHPAPREPVVLDRGRLAGTELGRALSAAAGVETALIVPLVVASSAVGLLAIFFHGERLIPTDELRRYRTLGDQAAVAIENARLFQRERDSVAHLRAVLDSIRDAIVVIDAGAGRIDCNPAALELLGLPQDGPAQARARVGDLPPAVRDLATAIDADGSAPPAGEALIEAAAGDGGGRTIEYATTRDFLPGRHLIVLRDVTERRELEARLAQAERLEGLGRLAGGVAHDFNNLLNAIGGFAGLIREESTPGDRRRDDAEQIIRAVERAAELTTGLLSFSRRQVLQPSVVDPNELVEGATPLLRRLLGSGIQIMTTLRSAGAVEVDPTQLEQVIVNLAINARDAMPDGGRLSIETADVDLDQSYGQTHRTVRPGPYVMLAVSDTGIGMDAGTQRRAFEPFFTTKPVGSGTGLGLATAHGFINQSGGHIWVYSEPGKGSTFKIYLPRVERVEPGAASSSPAARPVGGSEWIVLVDDDDGSREFIRRALETYGYRVTACPSPADALTVLAGHSEEIDLLVTDLVMPGMSGRDLAERIRASRPGLPVLYISGYNEAAAMDRGEIGDDSHFLPKPFAPTVLARSVRQALDRRGK